MLFFVANDNAIENVLRKIWKAYVKRHLYYDFKLSVSYLLLTCFRRFIVLSLFNFTEGKLQAKMQ